MSWQVLTVRIKTLIIYSLIEGKLKGFECASYIIRTEFKMFSSRYRHLAQWLRYWLGYLHAISKCPCWNFSPASNSSFLAPVLAAGNSSCRYLGFCLIYGSHRLNSRLRPWTCPSYCGKWENDQRVEILGSNTLCGNLILEVVTYTNVSLPFQ